LHVAVLGATPQPAAALPIAPALPLQAPREFIPPAELASVPVRLPGRLLNFLHRHSLVTFALLFLLVGSAATQVAGNYQAARIEAAAKPALALKSTVPTIAGLNLTVPSGQLQAKLQTITSQPATLTVGTQSVAVSPDTIKSWLQITSSADKSQDYIRIKAGAITASLNQLTNTYVKAPVSQVTVTHTDGTPSGVIVAGQNGTMLTDPGSLATQAQQIAKTVMDGKGLQFSTPLQSVPFQAVTPAAFGKLLEADVTTNRLYAYENGQLVNTFLATAGAPATPTPIGEFHIWAKFTVQTMKGFNPNGTPYIQPNVPWINYFDHSGDAVHGNYWRPASVFGNVSTSHGCVGIQVNDAEWVYNWAPIGTTVITHA
jgi:lipoprotein-anchoring transpeptidase ErfK/SrfK